MLGSVASASRLTVVAGAVRGELKMAEESAVTVTSSVTATVVKLNLRSVATPRLAMTSLVVWGWKPLRETVTVYGPPTLMPGMENLPSARVAAWYRVPDGSCTAITVAPVTGCCWGSVTMPVTEPVVTPCPYAWPTGHNRAQNARKASVLQTMSFIRVLLKKTRGICVMTTSVYAGWPRGNGNTGRGGVAWPFGRRSCPSITGE